MLEEWGIALQKILLISKRIWSASVLGEFESNRTIISTVRIFLETTAKLRPFDWWDISAEVM